MAEIRCPLYEASIISKHEPAIVCEERVVLYYELDEMVSLVASHLHRAGCTTGTRVGLFLPQDWRYVVLLLGIIRAGCVACPMNTRLPPARAIELFKSIRAGTIIARVDAARRRALGDLQILDPDEVLTRTPADQPLVWSEHMDLERHATIVFTSGSTGEPKAALHSYGNHFFSARGANYNVKVSSHDRWLLSLPLYHVGGLGIIFRCLLGGATVAVPEPGEPLEEAQERMKVTHLSLVSTQLHRAIRGRKEDGVFPGVKAILLGGGPASPALIRDALALKLPIYPSYGLTEMASQVATVLPASPPDKRYTSGKVLRNRQLLIADDGEILVCGETLFKGYVDGDRILPGLDENGWFRTGDLGAIDEDEYLTVLGRKDNMFISGGENIQPEEIEKAIMTCAGVEDCVVVPVPDAEFGHRPVAFVKGELNLRTALEEFLPRYKIPVAFHEWPQEAEGDLKPDRKRFAALAAERKIS